ncbi:MAG TPA: epoxyqueuosine reductase QueH [Candidatus Magasanikbacteria bacterium]|nr:epoxyqueuosine reductase QueH [Candidatus Magasanikbacteria bacterium]
MKKILLHTCCAPCSIAVIDELKKQYDLTVFFYNPNIFPEEEYLKRKAEVVRVCAEWKVPMIDMDYEWEKWGENVVGLEGEPEGGKRCIECFKMRLRRTAEYARDNGFEMFCTTLTSGRNKKAEVINPIGLELGKEFGVEFFVEDWKTGGSTASALSGLRRSRQERASQLIKEKGIYRQNYCGCVYSAKKSKDPAFASREL